MTVLTRSESNPIFSPDRSHSWESEATFNGSVVKDGDSYHMVYRAISSRRDIQGVTLNLSTIGYARSKDGVHFEERKQLVTPEYDWEKFGCEDPRITKIDDTYYIFYTAISSFPPNAGSIKVALATTKDFNVIETKHLVTPFNAKACALFPEKINGKYWVIITPHTDMPPAKIALISFDRIEQMWDENYWQEWYAHLPNHVLPLQRDIRDQVEVGTVPVKTDKGWLIMYSYIKNYVSQDKIFGVEAILLDKDNPTTIISKTHKALMVPEAYYERYGDVPNIVFPTGLLLKNDEVALYYGNADTAVSLAKGNIQGVFDQLSALEDLAEFSPKLIRFEGNPIMEIIQNHLWEATAVLNAAVILLDEKIHIVYRAISKNNISTMGYASSVNGYYITERLNDPIFVPSEPFESLGCEDPRLTRIDDIIYVCYTAYDGKVPRVAMSSILVSDFVAKKWNWNKPIIISPPAISDKDACVFPEKIADKYWILHRIDTSIWIDSTDDLEFKEKKWVTGTMLFGPRKGKWDDEKIGIAGPPIKTDFGWLLIYHGISRADWKYRLGIVVLDLLDPSKVIYHMDDHILEPLTSYENAGVRPGTVFSCGQVVKDDTLFVYYGASDQSIAVARCHYPSLLSYLKPFCKT